MPFYSFADHNTAIKMGYIETANYAAWHIPCYANHNCPKRPPRFISSDTTTEKPIKNVYAGINALVRNIKLYFVTLILDNKQCNSNSLLLFYKMIYSTPPCSVSLAIRQSPCTKGCLTQNRKPPSVGYFDHV